jgi:hypothetical protein
MARNLTDIYVGVNKADENRNKNDLYPTPPLATYALIKTLGHNMPDQILEPCAGRGHIAAELRRHGYDVTATDLHKYDDLVSEVISGHDATIMQPMSPDTVGVITNPPYHKDLPRVLTEKWLNEEYRFIAMFVRLTFLEGKKRKKLFTKYPPSHIIFLSDRVNFGPVGLLPTEPVEKKDQIGGMIAYAWVIFEKNTSHDNTKCHWVMLDDLYDEWRNHYDASLQLSKCQRFALPGVDNNPQCGQTSLETFF